MNKPISTRTHALLDYLTVGTYLALPHALGWSRGLTNAVTAAAIGKLAYALCTRHEGGVIKAVPMKTHLVLDALAGASMAALPFTVDADDECNESARFILPAMGTFDIAAAPMTETTSTVEDAPVTPAVIRRTGERMQQAVQTARETAGNLQGM